jgi:hypothetical protein
MLCLPFMRLQVDVDRVLKEFGAIAVEDDSNLIQGLSLVGFEVEGDGVRVHGAIVFAG